MSAHELFSRRDFLRFSAAAGFLAAFGGVSLTAREAMEERTASDAGISRLRNIMLNVENTPLGREQVLNATIPLLSYTIASGGLEDLRLKGNDPSKPYEFRIHRYRNPVTAEHSPAEYESSRIANRKLIPTSSWYTVEMPAYTGHPLYNSINKQGKSIDRQETQWVVSLPAAELSHILDSTRFKDIHTMIHYGTMNQETSMTLDLQNLMGTTTYEVRNWYRTAVYPLLTDQFISGDFLLAHTSEERYMSAYPRCASSRVSLTLDADLTARPVIGMNLDFLLGDQLYFNGELLRVDFEKGRDPAVPELLSFMATDTSGRIDRTAFRLGAKQATKRLVQGLHSYAFTFPLSRDEGVHV